MKKLYLHALYLRIWHWANALCVIILIATGMQMRIPHVKLVQDYRFAVAIHKYVGFVLVISYLFWLISYLVRGGLKEQYQLTFSDIRKMPGQALYYAWGLFRGKENPFKPSPAHRFNPMQKVAYSFIMFLSTPVILLTGILFSDILSFRNTISIIGGVRVLDAIHVIFAYFFVIYLLIHIYMATLGAKPYTHIKAMIVGYEDEETEDSPAPAPEDPT